MSEQKTCLLLVNTASGNAGKIVDSEYMHERLRGNYAVVHELRVGDIGDFDLAAYCDGYDAVAVCGGDGTLNFAVNAVASSQKELLYFPCGTMNDFAHSLKAACKESKTKSACRESKTKVVCKEAKTAVDLGDFNGKLFSYVAAAGTFTAIGYGATVRRKKLFKRLAYCFSALKEYRVHKIKAKINLDGRAIEGVYTLIMFVKSSRVFGLNFNKLFRCDSGSGHLLLISSPTGLFKLTKLFCRFYRAFFVGFKKEADKEGVKYFSFTEAVLELEKACNFCVDGEKWVSFKRNKVKILKEKVAITVL